MTGRARKGELKKYPEDMPVACCGDIYYPPEKYKVEISQRTWVDNDYAWDGPGVEYIN